MTPPRYEKKIDILVPEIVSTLKRMLAVHEALMPGIRHIAVQNYQEVNEAPIAAMNLLKKLETLDSIKPDNGFTISINGKVDKFTDFKSWFDALIDEGTKAIAERDK
jgi:hypothetical protein